MKDERKKRIGHFLSRYLVFAAVLFLTFWCGSARTEAATPYKTNGQLSVKNGKVVNSKGKAFVIQGVSTHGLGWFPEYVNKEAFKTLRDKWGVNTIRLAMYSAEYNGYCTGGDQAQLKKLVDNGVKYARDLGMYVIIDWHILSDGNPLTYKTQANSFFKYAAKKYKDDGHVLFEICNEPNGSEGSWANIKSYAKTIIKTIRSVNKNAIIIVGTPTWSQDVDVAQKSPITGYSNIAYAFHFYSGTHRDSLRTKLEGVLKKNFPVIVTEFGVSEASGNGNADTAEADKWMKLLDKYSVGRVCWSLCNKAETASLLKSSCTKKSGWSTSDLSTAGQWLVKTYTKNTSGTAPKATPTPKPTATPKPSAKPGTTPTPKPAASGKSNEGVSSGSVKLKATVKRENTWKSGSSTFTQYKVTIKNTGSRAGKKWTVTISFGKKYTLSSQWCGTFTRGSKKITIKPEAWNTALEKGQSTEVGFIVEASAVQNVKKVTVTAS